MGKEIGDLLAVFVASHPSGMNTLVYGFMLEAISHQSLYPPIDTLQCLFTITKPIGI